MIALCLPALFTALALNLAHQDLLHWSPLLPYEEGRLLLKRAIYWGERGGTRWLEHGHGQRAHQLLSQMQSEAWSGRFRSWSAFETGQQLEAQGQIEAAIIAYQDAVKQTELRVPALYAIYRLMHTSDMVAAEEYLYHLTALDPAVQVHWIANDQYQLLGFDLDEWSVAWHDAHIPIVLYWQSSAIVDTPQQWTAGNWTYIQVGERLYQIGTVRNLLPNGGFEQDLSTLAALPMGYKNTRDSRLRESSEIAVFLRQHHSLLVDQRNNYLSQVTAMNSPPEQANGFSAPRVPVEANTLYLLSGWMRTVGECEGYLAGIWEKDKIEFLYWEIADWSSTLDWQQYAEVSMSPPEVDRFRFVAVQRGASRTLFDDLLFCRLDPPNLDNVGN